jgi:hypothetical protein
MYAPIVKVSKAGMDIPLFEQKWVAKRGDCDVDESGLLDEVDDPITIP